MENKENQNLPNKGCPNEEWPTSDSFFTQNSELNSGFNFPDNSFISNQEFSSSSSSSLEKKDPFFSIWTPLPNNEPTSDWDQLKYQSTNNSAGQNENSDLYSINSTASCKNFSQSPQHLFEFSKYGIGSYQSSAKLAALSNGNIKISLRKGITAHITVDNAIHIYSEKNCTALALSSDGLSSALIHPNGRVFQCGKLVEVVAFDGKKHNYYIRRAKIGSEGITLTSTGFNEIFIVDKVGTRQTFDTFVDLREDFSPLVYSFGSLQGMDYATLAENILQQSKYYCYEGTELYQINNYSITQDAYGFVEFNRDNNNYSIKVNPKNGSINFRTPLVNFTASMGNLYHLFVKCGPPRIYFDGAAFTARNRGHSAGFDKNNLLVIG